jgi:hypothetical protein
VPVIGQVAPSLQLSAEIGVTGYTAYARHRKVEISDAIGMTTPEVTTFSADEFPASVLSTSILVTRASGTANLTRYVRVSHSSNGRDFGPVSNVLAVTFADSGGSGGSPGNFDPLPPKDIEIENLS